jgi:hypothetical protein
MRELGYIPARIVGGESIWIAEANTAQDSEDIILDGFTPADGYTLAYQFAADTPISVDAVANGDNTGWTLNVTGTQTLTFTPGRVSFVGIVSHTTPARSHVVDSGGIYVNPSPMRVSAWKAVLTAIDAAMLTAAGTPNGSISVDGMSMSYRGVSDLKSLRDYAVEQLRRDTGRRAPSRILSEFT